MEAEVSNPDREETELENLVAETHKLEAERRKINDERKKLAQELKFYPYGIAALWVASITAVIKMLNDIL